MVETNSKHDNIDDIKEVTSDKASFEDNEEKFSTSLEEEVLEKKIGPQPPRQKRHGR